MMSGFVCLTDPESYTIRSFGVCPVHSGWTGQWIEARLIWTKDAVPPTETSSTEVRVNGTEHAR